jgi:hypothetical protein
MWIQVEGEYKLLNLSETQGIRLRYNSVSKKWHCLVLFSYSHQEGIIRTFDTEDEAVDYLNHLFFVLRCEACGALSVKDSKM